ncbi:MAG TPA: AAA family ATPase [Deltaproteobacteria bacterium]|nr:AAA family ATPase [Deltaproteobacteria bacterium]HPR53946.1 AAA family ATPase [Deltaproteobacteria bacterium]HXK46746.1 AAA family ATPase [Deltaproteobacteria bacterium]
MPHRIISISNQKGGVGKTTTAINLGASLALLGKRALIIDLDPQANATTGLGFDPSSLPANIYHVMLGQYPFDSIIVPSKVGGLFLAPSHTDLVGTDVELMDVSMRERIIANAIADITTPFDFLIIDCPPSLGLLTLNALTASHSLLIPVQCEYYALEGLKSLLNTFSLVKKRLNPSLNIEGFLLTMFDSRTKLSHEVAGNMRDHFDSQVFSTVIPRNTRLCEAPSYGLPICLYDISSKGAQHYLMLAKEILSREVVNEDKASSR